jgi:hypothetical protein
MRPVRSLVLVSFVLVTTAVHAQATRTWVSGVGNDANPCSRTAPCKTFAGAISKTAAGGEISVLDPGGFGAVTITKSITINGEGVVSGILNAGTNGIIINALSTDKVNLRHLFIHGVNNGIGVHGIRVLSASSVNIDDVHIYNIGSATTSHGINIQNSAALDVQITNSSVWESAGNGILINGTALARVTLDNVQLHDNGVSGLKITQNGKVAVRNSSFANNTDAGLDAASATAEVNAIGSSFSGNANGILSNTGAIVRLHSSQIVGNTVNGLNGFGGAGTTATAGNNQVLGNAGNENFNVVAGQQ